MKAPGIHFDYLQTTSCFGSDSLACEAGCVHKFQLGFPPPSLCHRVQVDKPYSSLEHLIN